VRFHPATHPVRRRLILASGLWLTAVVSPVRSDTPAVDLPPGTLIERVTCAGDAEQSYALYLPANHTAERAWPIVFCFDPAARGRERELLRTALAKGFQDEARVKQLQASLTP
jgi:hypothetical protein